MFKEILIATTNKGKVAEFKLLLTQLQAFQQTKFLTLKDFPKIEAPLEIGETFEENAKIKAEFYFKNFKMPVIVEDSGFCVKELNNLPGVHSAEWGINGDFTEGIKKIYKMLDEKNSSACFYSIIILKSQEKTIMAEGIVEGEIAKSPKGEGGFGFDPCFIPNGFSQTFAEMGIEAKSKLSHRKMAILNLIAKL